jgi:hypothetical protein
MQITRAMLRAGTVVVGAAALLLVGALPVLGATGSSCTTVPTISLLIHPRPGLPGPLSASRLAPRPAWPLVSPDAACIPFASAPQSAASDRDRPGAREPRSQPPVPEDIDFRADAERAAAPGLLG